jgi:hypothetical protein
MKILALLTVITFSLPAFSRIYIQCADSNSWDRAVINLNGDQSTLFMTNGVHLPDEIRVLKDLSLVSESTQELVYETTDGNIKDVVFIPVEDMQSSPNYFMVDLQHTRISSGYSQTRSMSCFSSTHND